MYQRVIWNDELAKAHYQAATTFQKVNFQQPPQYKVVHFL